MAMDEIEQRLRESADHCFTSYAAWRANEQEASTREALQDAVHELRKVASRVEIELAISERKEMAQKPIPIPPHRDARGRHQSAPEGEDGDDIGNMESGFEARPPRLNNQNAPNNMRRRTGGGSSFPRRGGPSSEGSSGGSGGNS